MALYISTVETKILYFHSNYSLSPISPKCLCMFVETRIPIVFSECL